MIYLSGQNYNARDIVQNIFSPLVGVITSPLADEVCQRNNLTFAELLQPFAKLQSDAHFRDVAGTSVSIRGLRLNFCDIDWRPPQPMLARKMLNEAVNAAANTTMPYTIDGEAVQVPKDHPWFEQWRETFLNVQFPADHEFTRHFISCIVVLCSSDPNIVETAHKLTLRIHETQMAQPQRLPKWFHATNVLNNYVILQEGHTDLLRAQQSCELLRSTFSDTMCFLIQTNSLDEATRQTRSSFDHWLPFVQRSPKAVRQEMDLQLNQQSIGLKSSQDSSVPVMLMPTQLTEASPFPDADAQPIMAHPLSPLRESVADAINSKFSVSTESISSQSMTTSVWPNETDGNPVGNGAADVHGALLNATDVENLRHFVQDYAVRALVPYVEQQVAALSEAVMNKKGVSKSLLSATKRWFATSKPIGGGNAQNAVIYTHESVELQTRKLADLYFMFGHYNLAFQAYHQAKRDFNADSAWQYYAGALEMTALAAFMTGTASRKTYDYMEDAIQCYLNVCKLPQFATRATLLSAECLKHAQLHTESAKQLLRMISEDADLRSALLLEQAAYCFLACPQPTAMYRKYAFHIVLAGNRFARAGQRRHAYRCYKQAHSIFRERGWSLASDHIQYTLAKQAYTLKKFDEAGESIASLMRADSVQSAGQQVNFFREYIQTQLENLQQNPDVNLLTHVLPVIAPRSMRVLLAAPPSKSTAPFSAATGIDINSTPTEELIWQKIEEMLVATAAAPGRPHVFKPAMNLIVDVPGGAQPLLAVQSEPMELCVRVQNTVRFGLVLSEISLLWQLALEQQAKVLTNLSLYGDNAAKGNAGSSEALSKTAMDAVINIATVPNVALGEHEACVLHFKVTPKITGTLSIVGVVCQVGAAAAPPATPAITISVGAAPAPPSTTTTTTTTTASPQLDSPVRIEGALLFDVATSASSKPPVPLKMLRYDDLANELLDRSLAVRILPSQTYLDVGFSAVPNDLLAGEIVPVTMLVRNMGFSPVGAIFLGCECPRWLTLSHNRTAQVPLTLMARATATTNGAPATAAASAPSNIKLAKDKEIRRQYVYRVHKGGQPLSLAAQEVSSVEMWLQAPYQHGHCTLRVLLYYEPPATTAAAAGGPRYRLLRHTWQFNVQQCVRLESAVVVSNGAANDMALEVVVANEMPEQSPLRPLVGDAKTGGAAGRPLEVKELCVNSLSLFSEKLALVVSKWFVLNEVGTERGQLAARCLTRPKSSLSLQCHLSGRPNLATDTADLEQWLQHRLSTITLADDSEADKKSPAPPSAALPLHEAHSFLVKNETRFLKSTISADDFNNLVAEVDTHQTVALCWSALVADPEASGSGQRLAHGQHFVQLRRLNEIVRCASGTADAAASLAKAKSSPHTMLLNKGADAAATPAIADIADGRGALQSFTHSPEEDYWESNDCHVGKRCLLEDEPSAAMAIKLYA